MPRARARLASRAKARSLRSPLTPYRRSCHSQLSLSIRSSLIEYVGADTLVPIDDAARKVLRKKMSETSRYDMEFVVRHRKTTSHPKRILRKLLYET